MIAVGIPADLSFVHPKKVAKSSIEVPKITSGIPSNSLNCLLMKLLHHAFSISSVDQEDLRCRYDEWNVVLDLPPTIGVEPEKKVLLILQYLVLVLEHNLLNHCMKFI